MTSQRRANDEEGGDFRTIRNGTGGPWWARWIAFVGIPGFLLIFLLGGIPWLPSPFLRLGEIEASLNRHGEETRRMLEIWRVTCEGVWRGDRERQGQCGQAARGTLRRDE